jgi:hypothetical protein
MNVLIRQQADEEKKRLLASPKGSETSILKDGADQGKTSGRPSV